MINERVEKTWEECGRRVRPQNRLVFIRTEPLPEFIGKIYIPPGYRTNYAGLPHTVMFQGLVIGVGSKVKTIKVGDCVAFSRLFFARWQEMADKTLVGWVDEENIFGTVEEQNLVENTHASSTVAPEPGASLG